MEVIGWVLWYDGTKYLKCGMKQTKEHSTSLLVWSGVSCWKKESHYYFYLKINFLWVQIIQSVISATFIVDNVNTKFHKHDSVGERREIAVLLLWGKQRCLFTVWFATAPATKRNFANWLLHFYNVM